MSLKHLTSHLSSLTPSWVFEGPGVCSRCLGSGGESLRASPAEPTAASYATWASVSVAWRWPVFRGVTTRSVLLAKQEKVGKPCSSSMLSGVPMVGTEWRIVREVGGGRAGGGWLQGGMYRLQGACVAGLGRCRMGSIRVASW